MPELSVIVPFVNEYPQNIFTLQSISQELRAMPSGCFRNCSASSSVTVAIPRMRRLSRSPMCALVSSRYASS